MFMTFDGSGSGSLNGVPFSNTAFTITENADTANVVNLGLLLFSLDSSSASINIQGLGNFTFTSGTRTYVAGSVVGFARSGITGTNLFDSNGSMPPSSSPLYGWDMQ